MDNIIANIHKLRNNLHKFPKCKTCLKTFIHVYYFNNRAETINILILLGEQKLLTLSPDDTAQNKSLHVRNSSEHLMVVTN